MLHNSNSEKMRWV